MVVDNSDAVDDRYQSFYSERRDQTYGRAFTDTQALDHTFYPVLKEFISKYKLEDKRCLEIGSSGGGFQDMVEDYYGTDITPEVAPNYHKPYRVAQGSRYPFDDNFFDAIWTYAVFEHIPDLQAAMNELHRLLKPGGLLLFNPAWQCRPWAADGYTVRPYKDFGIAGKLIKFSIPFRNNILYRSSLLFPKRLLRQLMFMVTRKQPYLRYRKIKPNYDVYWTSDSDACNSIDPHDAILWFQGNGFECLSHPLHLKAFLVRTGAIVLQKRS